MRTVCAGSVLIKPASANWNFVHRIIPQRELYFYAWVYASDTWRQPNIACLGAISLCKDAYRHTETGFKSGKVVLWKLWSPHIMQVLGTTSTLQIPCAALGLWFLKVAFLSNWLQLELCLPSPTAACLRPGWPPDSHPAQESQWPMSVSGVYCKIRPALHIACPAPSTMKILFFVGDRKFWYTVLLFHCGPILQLSCLSLLHLPARWLHNGKVQRLI